ETHVVGDRRATGHRLQVSPSGVFDEGDPGIQRIMCGGALERRFRRGGTCHQELLPHIRYRKIIDRKVIRLLHHESANGVSDDYVSHADPKTLGRGHRKYDVARLKRVLLNPIEDREMRPATTQVRLAHAFQLRVTRSSSRPAAMGTKP